MLRLVSCLFTVLVVFLACVLCMLPLVFAMNVVESSPWHAQKAMLAWGVACVYVVVMFKS